MQEKTKLYRRRVLAALGVSALAVGVLTGSAQAAAPAANVSSPSLSAARSGDAVAYWTPARMAAAKSLDVTPPRGTPGPAAAPETTGPPASVPPAAGSVPPAATPPPSGPQPLAAVMVPRPYTTLPARLNGKLFFTQNGGNFVCSGTVVNGDNKDMVDTAGHCVSDGRGHFDSVASVMFVPAYSSAATGCPTVPGCFPYGKWTARTLTTRTEWHVNGNFKQDYGYVVLNTLNGQHIVNLLGGQGTAFNFSRSQTFNSYGYPQAAPFNGFDQKLCVSARLGDDNPSAGPGPLTIRIDCNMTGGSSGGGWLIGLSGGLGYVNSHNSYRYTNTPNNLFGPYYGNEVLSLFNFTKTM
ncbi:MAG: hypothetical protein ACRDSR_02750 [Pseudonocardiaceae bacterium]